MKSSYIKAFKNILEYIYNNFYHNITTLEPNSIVSVVEPPDSVMGPAIIELLPEYIVTLLVTVLEYMRKIST